MRPLVIFHKSDLDGVCSAAIVKHFVPDVELYGLEYGEVFDWDRVRPGPYADEDPLWKDCFLPENGYKGPEQNGGYAMESFRWTPRQVYLVDFSLSVPDMRKLATCCKLVWCDHHQIINEVETRFEVPAGLGSHDGTPTPMMEMTIEGVQDVSLAACELCWAYFTHRNDMSPVKEIPEAVHLLGIYDSWRKDDSDWQKALEFQYGMRGWLWVYDPDAAQWQHLLNGQMKDPDLECMWSFERTMHDGEAILRYQAEVNQRACESGAHELVIRIPDPERQPFVTKDTRGEEVLMIPGPKFRFESDGSCSRVPEAVMPSFRAIACNTIVFNSQFFESVYDPEKHDVMCAYAQMKDGRWRVSLYSTKPTINCGGIAKAFGGGGHKGAAGFVCDKLPWEA